MTTVTMEVKQSKILELSNLISQYDNGERENINVNEYSDWGKIVELLKSADIDESIYDDFLVNPTHYKNINAAILYNENWQQEEIEKEQLRIAKLHMTKLDFFKYVLKPNGITYTMLQELLHTDENLNATWQLCNHVYRGDETLNSFIFAKLPTLMPEQLTAIFEQYGVSEE